MSQLGEASRTILHGICARAPSAADASAPPTRLARRPARCSRPASATAAGAGSGVGRPLELDFDSHRCQVGGGEHGGHSTEQFGDRGACSPDTQLAACHLRLLT